MAKTYHRTGRLTHEEEDRLAIALGVIPDNIDDCPYCTRVRRGEIERRRISILKADKPAPKLSINEETHELFWLGRLYHLRDGFNRIGWALRIRATGDYYIYSQTW